MLNINNPYKMKWTKGTKVQYTKAPLLVSDKNNDAVESSDIPSKIKEGAILEVVKTFNCSVPYADVIDNKGNWHMIDLRNLKKV